MKYCFGVDIGGTTVKMGLFEATGTILEKWEIKTHTEEEGKAIVLRPSADYGVTRYTSDKELLQRWFDLGYEDTEKRLTMIREFMES